MNAAIWAVELQSKRGMRTLREVKYVRAASQQGAARTALENTFMDGHVTVVATRYATPEELGCTAVTT
jgi:hypothetical protein